MDRRRDQLPRPGFRRWVPGGTIIGDDGAGRDRSARSFLSSYAARIAVQRDERRAAARHGTRFACLASIYRDCVTRLTVKSTVAGGAGARANHRPDQRPNHSRFQKNPHATRIREPSRSLVGSRGEKYNAQPLNCRCVCGNNEGCFRAERTAEIARGT